MMYNHPSQVSQWDGFASRLAGKLHRAQISFDRGPDSVWPFPNRQSDCLKEERDWAGDGVLVPDRPISGGMNVICFDWGSGKTTGSPLHSLMAAFGPQPQHDDSIGFASKEK